MKKKLFFSTLCFVLLLIMMLSTTLAWFTDTAANVNTMVAGKVSIVQTLVDTQVTVVPTVTLDRTITVKNDGNLPCYVRTLIAFEDAAFKVEDEDKTLVEYLTLGDANVVFPVDAEGKPIQYTRDGVTYTIGYYIYNKLVEDTEDTYTYTLEAGQSYTCLESITLYATAPSEWQIACGDQYQILVLSQAVQTAGFEPAENVTAADAATAALNNESVFGVVNAENVKTWFDTVLTTTTP